MTWIKPRPVGPGGLLGIVAPAGPVEPAALAAGLERLHRLGYRTLVGAQALDQQGYLAGCDQARAADFNALWANPAVEAVLCARGGYGAMRMLEAIDWELVRAVPKALVGFSDITALHLALGCEARLVSFHGPMAAAFGQADRYNGVGLRRALRERRPLGRIPWPAAVEAGAPLPQPVTIFPGAAVGRLLGGNLSLLVALLGSRWEPDLTGILLLLEEVDEAPYRVDRMLTQLRLAGKLKGLAGIIWGDSPSCQGAPGGPDLIAVLTEQLAPLAIPVLYGFPCGHTAYRATIPLGVMARLDAGCGSLTILEPALA